MNESYKYELLEKYLHGQLNEYEKIEWEEYLISNPEWAIEVHTVLLAKSLSQRQRVNSLNTSLCRWKIVKKIKPLAYLSLLLLAALTSYYLLKGNQNRSTKTSNKQQSYPLADTNLIYPLDTNKNNIKLFTDKVSSKHASANLSSKKSGASNSKLNKNRIETKRKEKLIEADTLKDRIYNFLIANVQLPNLELERGNSSEENVKYLEYIKKIDSLLYYKNIYEANELCNGAFKQDEYIIARKIIISLQLNQLELANSLIRDFLKFEYTTELADWLYLILYFVNRSKQNQFKFKLDEISQQSNHFYNSKAFELKKLINSY